VRPPAARVDFQQRPGSAALSRSCASCAVGTQFIEFRGEVRRAVSGACCSLCSPVVRAVPAPAASTPAATEIASALLPFREAGLRAVQRGRTACQFLAQLVAFGLSLSLPSLRLRDRALRLELRGRASWSCAISTARVQSGRRQLPGRGLQFRRQVGMLDAHPALFTQGGPEARQRLAGALMLPFFTS